MTNTQSVPTLQLVVHGGVADTAAIGTAGLAGNMICAPPEGHGQSSEEQPASVSESAGAKRNAMRTKTSNIATYPVRGRSLGTSSCMKKM